MAVRQSSRLRRTVRTRGSALPSDSMSRCVDAHTAAVRAAAC